MEQNDFENLKSSMIIELAKCKDIFDMQKAYRKMADKLTEILGD